MKIAVPMPWWLSKILQEQNNTTTLQTTILQIRPFDTHHDHDPDNRNTVSNRYSHALSLSLLQEGRNSRINQDPVVYLGCSRVQE
jgi:hypothetical protein